MSDATTYRVGLIGCGRKGHGHARGYVGNPRTELAAAADPDRSNMEIFLNRFPVKEYGDYHQMLARQALHPAAPKGHRIRPFATDFFRFRTADQALEQANRAVERIGLLCGIGIHRFDATVAVHFHPIGHPIAKEPDLERISHT